jgi:hypothetical protein
VVDEKEQRLGTAKGIAEFLRLSRLSEPVRRGLPDVRNKSLALLPG